MECFFVIYKMPLMLTRFLYNTKHRCYHCVSKWLPFFIPLQYLLTLGNVIFVIFAHFDMNNVYFDIWISIIKTVLRSCYLYNGNSYSVIFTLKLVPATSDSFWKNQFSIHLSWIYLTNHRIYLSFRNVGLSRFVNIVPCAKQGVAKVSVRQIMSVFVLASLPKTWLTHYHKIHILFFIFVFNGLSYVVSNFGRLFTFP